MAEPVVIEARMRDELSRPLRLVRGEMDQTARAAANTGRAGGVGAAGLTRMEVASQRLHKALGTVHSRLTQVSSYLGSALVTGVRRGALAFGGLAAVVTAFGVKASSQFQQSQLAFETLLGSAAKGQELFKQLQTLNLKTPFELGDLTSSTQVLLRYGAAQGQVVPIMKSLSDIAATSDNPAENLGRLSLAIGQVISQGRLLGQDARQLAEAGFNPYAVLASKLGKTQEEVRKLGEQGKLSASDLIGALIAESNGLERFRGGAEKMNQTLRGQLSNLKDQINIQLATAAQPLTALLTAQMPMIVALVGSLVSQIGPPIFGLVAGIGQTLLQLLPAVAPVVQSIAGGLLMLLRAGGPALAALQPLGGEIGKAITEFATALVPIMPDLVQLLGGMLMILPDFIRLLIQLLPLVSSFVGFANLLLGYEPVRKILAGLLTVLLGYRVLSSVVGALTAFATGLRAVAGAQTEVNIANAGGGAGGVAGAGGLAGGRGGKLARAGAGVAGGIGLLADLQGATQGQSAGADLAFVGSGTAAGFGVAGPTGALVGGTLSAGFVGARRAWEFFGGGDVSGNLAASSRVHAIAAGRTPGRSPVTSTVRNFALSGPGSGHARGTAWDATPDYPHRYAGNIRALGGYAAVHDAGFGRHVHAQIGDASPVPNAAVGAWQGEPMPPIIIDIGQVVGQVDFERGVQRGVAAGLDQARRRRLERGHVDRLGPPV